MSKKKPAGKIKLSPIKPKDAIRKLENNGFICEEKHGGDWIYSRLKNGERKAVIVSVHPKDLGIPYVKYIIRASGKINEEWLGL